MGTARESFTSILNRPTSKRLLILTGLVGMLAIAWIVWASQPRVRDDGGPRPKCESNLHQIGLAVLLYESDFGGKAPDTLDQTLYEQLLPSVFVCPASTQTSAEVSSGATTQQSQDALLAGNHVSYIYLGKGLTDKTTPDNAVIAYEPLINHGNGMCVLFGDGHVEFLNVTRGQQIIAAAATTTRPVMVPP